MVSTFNKHVRHVGLFRLQGIIKVLALQRAYERVCRTVHKENGRFRPIHVPQRRRRLRLIRRNRGTGEVSECRAVHEKRFRHCGRRMHLVLIQTLTNRRQIADAVKRHRRRDIG